MSEPRTLIVSNRLPVTVEADDEGALHIRRSSGGLVSGLEEIHRRADSLWIGHSGVFAKDENFARVSAELAALRLIPVHLHDETYRAYYNGMANGTLWPLCHYFPEQMRHARDDWEAYVAVNRSFTQKILELVAPGDRVWIHDYQLMLVPGMLRKAMADLAIAYFHHIPFPSSEMFRIFPQRQEILTGLLGADLVGFHTLDYVRHFLTGITRVLGGDVDRDEVHYQRRIVKVGAFPLGVDIEATLVHARAAARQPHIVALQRNIENQRVFLGIDRLDYTKGIPERLQAFRTMLTQHREMLGEVTYIQLCVPSRLEAPAYASLRSEVERLVGQINGEFARPGYVPLQYLFQAFSPEDVVALYRLADVMVVTPLRDGLNLVCKEYVAARSDDTGALILSEFTGAAAEMGEAFLVNPYDIDCVARKMYEALTTPVHEKRLRMQRLRQRIANYDNLAWSNDFLHAWDEVVKRRASATQHLVGTSLRSVVKRLLASPRKFIFLDYDGTLVPIARKPELALPSTELLATLAALGARRDVHLTIITGRSRAFCDLHFSQLAINLVAEHCSFIKKVGEPWEDAVNCDELQRIKPVVAPHLAWFVKRIPGSFIEEKETALVLHYREAEPVFAHAQAMDLRESLNQILTTTTYSAFKAKRAIEIKPGSANKAAAIENLLGYWGATGEEMIFTAGDDMGDEDMFLVHHERNISVHVGYGASGATYHVDAPADLLALLQRIDKLPPKDWGGRPAAANVPSKPDTTRSRALG